jgi:hypothetical protein
MSGRPVSETLDSTRAGEADRTDRIRAGAARPFRVVLDVRAGSAGSL